MERARQNVDRCREKSSVNGRGLGALGQELGGKRSQRRSIWAQVGMHPGTSYETQLWSQQREEETHFLQRARVKAQTPLSPETTMAKDEVKIPLHTKDPTKAGDAAF